MIAPAGSTGSSRHGVSAGDFAAVCIKQGRRPCYLFMAEIEEVYEDDEEVLVKYLVRSGDNVYHWPEARVQEYSTEPLAMIAGTLRPPSVYNQREQLKFLKTDIDNVLRKAQQKYQVVYFK